MHIIGQSTHAYPKPTAEPTAKPTAEPTHTPNCRLVEHSAEYIYRIVNAQADDGTVHVDGVTTVCIKC